MLEDPETKAMREEIALYWKLDEKERLRQELEAFRKKYKGKKLVPEPFAKAIAVLQHNRVRVTDHKRR
jgi:hypothetical protein